MSLLVERDAVAQSLLLATVVLMVAGEVAATYVAAAGRDDEDCGRSRLARLRGSIDTVVFARYRGEAPSEDRGTKRLLLGGMLAGLAVAWVIAAQVPHAGAGANSWPTLAIGIAIALGGVALRAWGVTTLGHHFQREVVIERGQSLVTSGPYRWVRHPAYAGNLLTVFGLGLMLGSWAGALAATLIAFVALLPRLRVEERALTGAFGEHYAAYAATTARLVPGLW